jgi:DNA-directed RNA polymerase subunit RPC12/RpoP
MSVVAVEGEVRYVCARCGAQKPASGVRCPACGVRIDVPVEPEAAIEARAAERRAARRMFRLYCVACGRSTEGPTPPTQVGRCPACGGTMLVELAAD